MHNYTKYTLAGLLALALTWASAFGQGVSTSGFEGTVTDKSGKPIAGATVTVLRTDSGTRSVTTTRSNGDYLVNGLLTGGPYTVTVAVSGFTPESKTGYFLNAGAQVTANFTVSSEVVQMEAVTVAGSQDVVFDPSAMGTSTTFNAAQITDIASVRGDVSDIINLDPRASVMQAGTSDAEYTISIQGQNPRSNLFLVDGVSMTDNFGLNSNGYAGTRSPIPFEWIDSAAILIDDYDLVYSGFTGGVLDMTLKSGTNDFHGSLYEEYEGNHFRGPDPVVGPLGPHEKVQDHTTGGTLSGPIIKDKLFFFVGYEAFREISAAPAEAFNPNDNGTDASVISQIVNQANALGYQVGSFTPLAHYWEQNFVAKIDWNISDTQKFDFTFRHTAGDSPVFYNYTASTETSTSSSFYNTNRIDQSYTAKLNSDWNSVIPGLTSEIEGTYRRYNGTSSLNGPDLPAVTIESISGASTTTAGTSPITSGKLFLGTYYAYQLNNIYTWDQEEHAYGTYAIGDHTFKFGAQFDRASFTDTFVPNYLGSYDFANAADFLNATPTYVNLAETEPGYTLGSDVSHFYQLTISPLIEDTWKPNSQLSLMAGVRMDDPYEPQKPPYNANFANTFGISNTGTINGNYTISPRFAFNYTFPSAMKTQIRGGAGLFVGPPSEVWLENSFNTAGQISTANEGSTSASAAPISSTYKFTGNPSTQATPPGLGGVAVPGIDLAASNFHNPANWKENIAFDRQLPFLDSTFTAEIDLSQVQEDVMYKVLNLQQATSGPLTTPDGAIRYAGSITADDPSGPADPLASSPSPSTPYIHSNFGQVYELVNTDKGGSQEYTLEIQRPMKDDWAYAIAYTHTHATQVDDLESSVASSNFEDQYFVNPNDDVAHRSQFAVPDKFVVSAAREFHFFPYKNMATTISAQFVAQTGQAYSYLFSEDADGSGFTNQDLFYVPTGPNDPKVTWANSAEETAFFQWLAGTPSLAKYAGQIAPRNAFYAGEQHTVNVTIEQQIPVWQDEVRMTLFASCYNFANLLNRNWGIVEDYDSTFNDVTVAGADYLQSGNGGAGQYVYRFVTSGSFPTFSGGPTVYSDMSRWAIEVGAKVEF